MSRLFFISLAILVISSCHEPCSANPYLTAKKAYGFAKMLYEKIVQIQKSIDAGNADNGIINRMDSKLLELSTDFQEFKLELMKKISSDLRTKLDVKTDEMFGYTRDIQRQYEKMIAIITNYENYPATYLENFADVITTLSLGQLRATIEKMHETFARKDLKNKSIINIIAKDSTAGDTMCVRAQSSQQVLNELFQLIVSNDAKGLMTTLYAYDLKKKFDASENVQSKYDFVKEKELENYYARVNSTYQEVKNALRAASREIWRCDPDNHVRDVTYAKPFDVFQGYVHREQDTLGNLKRLFIQECRSQKMEREICRSYDCWTLPKHRRCLGKLRNCDRLGRKHEICFAPVSDERKYINMEVGKNIYGPRETCTGEKKKINELISIYDPLSVCFCTCEAGDIEVDRYFSLYESTSDIEENKVVTGIRLTKGYNIYQIEVQQGTLGPNGEIVDKPEWKKNLHIQRPIVNSNPSITKFHVDVIETERANRDHIRKEIEYSEFFKNDMVYAVTYEQRIIYLDDLTVPEGQLLTGLQFEQVGDDLKLKIRGTPFDYATGKLEKDSSNWYSSSSNKQSRHEVLLDGSDSPALFTGSDILSKSGDYVKFTTTDARKDLAQNTIPFIDIQNVASTPSVPLTGAGIFHKRSKISGGFLALKIFHYDFSPHM